MKENENSYQVGDIVRIANSKIKIINIGRYENNKKNYTIKCLNCGVEKRITEKTLLNKKRCIHCSKNVFKISNDKSYWIGFTQKNEKFLFDGNDDIIKYIKSFTWRKNYSGYLQNRKGEKLHRIVMKVTNPQVFVNHVGGNKTDCRKKMLSISNCVDNSREKKRSNRNSTGIVGLLKRGKNNKYVGNIKPNGFDLYSPYKEKDEALIDLLIMQRHYGFRHNINLWYLLENVSKKRIKEVLDNCERQIKIKRKHSIKSKNIIKLSDDKKFFWVYDKNNKKFKISLNSKEALSKGIWYVSEDKNECYKKYVKGCIIIDGKRKSVKLHRYLMRVLNVKYKKWVIDHINGDGLDNRFENLIITDAKGNGHKINSKGYKERKDIKSKGHFRVVLTLNGIHYDKTFIKENDAKEYVKKIRTHFFKTRLQFSNKKELDKYLKTKEEN